MRNYIRRFSSSETSSCDSDNVSNRREETKISSRRIRCAFETPKYIKTKLEKSKEDTAPMSRFNSKKENITDLGPLHCPVCFYSDREKWLLCKKCGYNCCNICWKKILARSQKCPQCKEDVNKSKLVKNNVYDTLKEQQIKFENLLSDKVGRECHPHQKMGKHFCESCSSFICIQCIKEGIHSDHDICDVDEKPELKEKIKEINVFCRDLAQGPRLLDKVQHEHLDSVKEYRKALKQYATEMKTKLSKLVDKGLEPFYSEIKELEEKNMTVDDEISSLEQVITEIGTESLRTINKQQLVASFQDKLLNSEKSSLFSLVTPEGVNFSKDNIASLLGLVPEKADLERIGKVLKKELLENIENKI
ncbi:unnamed protein product [Moneuplotes crassus]|uniref:Uncharacterized protein n=1 Tax=Euplotes crassus TaxID=5936 RepID=A0AAD1UU35_EUPCR|nr:unnamed protein product [Moneuplotes crassus]